MTWFLFTLRRVNGGGGKECLRSPVVVTATRRGQAAPCAILRSASACPAPKSQSNAARGVPSPQHAQPFVHSRSRLSPPDEVSIRRPRDQPPSRRGKRPGPLAGARRRRRAWSRARSADVDGSRSHHHRWTRASPTPGAVPWPREAVTAGSRGNGSCTRASASPSLGGEMPMNE